MKSQSSPWPSAMLRSARSGRQRNILRTYGAKGFKLFMNGYPPPTCMEEEQEPAASGGGLRPEFVANVLRELMHERFEILKNEKWTVEEKARLLSTQRDTLSAVTGTTIRVFKSEQVVYAILVFSLVVLLCLAWLTAYANL